MLCKSHELHALLRMWMADMDGYGYGWSLPKPCDKFFQTYAQTWAEHHGPADMHLAFQACPCQYKVPLVLSLSHALQVFCRGSILHGHL